MLALRLDYLTGRAVATAYNDRGAAEWPPHPARVFSALVATWAEREADDASEMHAEQRALEWLEQLPAPALAFEEGAPRTVTTHFVPTNDATLLPKKLATAAFKRDETLQAWRVAQEQVQASAGGKGEKAALKAAEKAQSAWEKAQAQFQEACTRAFDAGPSSAEERGRAASLLPEARGRQPRTFPSMGLTDPVVHLCWPDVDVCEHQPALDRLARRLVRVGHSSSFVHARWVQLAPSPDWVPDDSGELLLRVPGPGQLAQLQAEFERHQGVEPRVLPFRVQRYRDAGQASASSRPGDARHFTEDGWIVLRRVGGPSLPLTRGVDIAQAVRGALMRHADDPIPEVISGHAPQGGPSRDPHLMILPLPHVGHRHADGGIRGVALLLPRALKDEDRHAFLRALGRWETQARNELGEAEEDAPTLKIGVGEGVVMEVQRQVWGDPGLATLRPATWCGASREWLSVTPVALDRNPGDLWHGDPAVRQKAYQAAAAIIARACENVGLPQPESVTVLPSGTWPGGAKAARFPAYPPGAGKVRRVKVHARVRFRESVSGPVVLGAGRFQGLGLFRSVREEGQA